jgi:hypothetical protein
MKKPLVFLLTLFMGLFAWQGNAQVPIGEQNGTTSNMPIWACYGYTYSQQIVYASEVNASGDITSISFYYVSGPYSNSDEWDIYMAHTAKTDFETNTDWGTIAATDKVFSGTVTYSATGNWTTITFDTPFTYNGTDNLLIGVHEYKTGYNCSVFFGKTADMAGGDRSIVYRNDGTNPDPTAPPSATSRFSYINTMILGGVAQSCPAPSDLVASAVGSSTATIDWTENGTATTWNALYGPVGFDPESSGTPLAVTTTPSASLTGLTPGTGYDFYVQSDCGVDGESSILGPLTFNTPCLAGTIPFTESFESGYTHGDIQGICWSQEDIAGSSEWIVNGSETTYNRTPRTGNFNTTLRYGNTDWMFYPLDLTGGVAYQLEFYARQDASNSSYASVEAAYGTANNDASMTNSIIASTPLINGVYQQVSGIFTPASDGVYYIGIKGTINGSPWYISLDDISVDLAPSCLAPSALALDGVTATTADISWTAGDTETAWNVSWGAAGYTPGDVNEVGTAAAAAAIYSISGLTSETTYDAYVQANCGGDLSPWTGPINFTTACDVQTTPWTDDVEGQTGIGKNAAVDGCWTASPTGGFAWNVSDSNTTSGSTGPDAAHSGSKFFFTESSNGSTGAIAELYSPIIDVSALTTPALSFYYHMYGATTGDLNVFVFDGTTWNLVTTLSGEQQTSGSDPWLEQMIALSGYTGNIQIKFEVTKGSSYTGDIAIDDISVIEAPACPAPTALTVTAVTSTSADATWTAGGAETAWNVSWGASGYTPGTDDIGTDTAAAATYQITGLAGNTDYDVYVQADCGGDLSTWTGPVSFTTQLVVAPTWEEGFLTTSTPEGWTRTGWSIGSNRGATGNPGNNIYKNMYGTGASSSGSFTTVNVGPVAAGQTLSFDYKASNYSSPYSPIGDNSGSFTVSISTDYGLNYTEVGSVTLPNDNAWQSELYPLDAYVGDVIKIKIEATRIAGDFDLAFDNFFVGIPPSCLAPTALTLDSATTTTADVSWMAGDVEAAWNVSWGTPGYTPGDADEINTAATVATTYQITGLTGSSSYHVYVQADCGGDTSTWSGPLAINTLIVNDNLCDALPITLDAISTGDAYTTVGATQQTGEPMGSCWFGTSSPQTVWFSFVAPSSGNVTVTTDIGGGTLNDTHIAIYEAATDCNDLTTLGSEVGCDEDGGTVGSGWLSVATMTGLTAGDTYYVQVDGYGSNTGTFGLEVHDDGYDGFVYESGVWMPSDPSADATPTDNITVMDGTTSFTTDMEVNDITVMSGATLNVGAVLTVNGDITNDGDLVFMSTATGNGELAAIAGTITGDVTVERYMQSKRSYRMVSSSVTTTTSVHDNWQEGATSNVDNPAPGFGTHITGSTTDQMNGFDGTITGNASMFTVNVGTQMFEAVANTNVNTLTAGEPYMLFVRGDRSIDLTNDLAAGETVLRATGTLATGTITQNFATVTAGNNVMFGNPYQSTVNVAETFEGSTNINDNMYYVYDSSLGDHGAYVTVTLPGGSNTSGSAANQFLQPGQAAQAATLADGASSVVFNEFDKAPGNFTSTNRPVSANDMLTVQLYTTENFNNGGPVHDSFGIIFAEGNDNGLTPADAVKPMNFYENLGVNNNGTYLSIEQRELPQVAEVYSMYTTGYTKSDYTLKVIVDGLETNFLYLDDHFTGTSMLLEAGENSYSYRVDANDALSIATDRFSIRTEQRLGVDENSLLAGIRLFPNPLNGDTFYINAPKLNGEQLSVSISDLSGRNIFEQTVDCRANTVTVPMGDNIASGVYLVTLTNGGESQTYRLIKE